MDAPVVTIALLLRVPQIYAANPAHVAVITDHIKPNLDAPPLAMDYEY